MIGCGAPVNMWTDDRIQRCHEAVEGCGQRDLVPFILQGIHIYLKGGRGHVAFTVWSCCLSKARPSLRTKEYEKRNPKDNRETWKRSVPEAVGAPAYSLRQQLSFMKLCLGVRVYVCRMWHMVSRWIGGILSLYKQYWSSKFKVQTLKFPRLKSQVRLWLRVWVMTYYSSYYYILLRHKSQVTNICTSYFKIQLQLSIITITNYNCRLQSTVYRLQTDWLRYFLIIV